jgi:DNA-binding XRE family transcriptional regulator
MLEAVKVPHINLSYENCDDNVIGRLVNALKVQFKDITITINSTPTEAEAADDDDEMVNAFESDFWKSATVGDLLAGYRLKHELTQKQLAKLAGMSHATISAYETGKKPLSRRSAIKLATAMGEDSDCFLKNVPGGK